MSARDINWSDLDAVPVPSGEFLPGTQIEILRPKVLVALGRHAAQTLLDTKVPMGRLRGQWFDWHGIALMPTFHPAYLLRNPAAKREVWDDMKAVLKRLGLPIPRPK